ncbi:MAG: beta-lactamase family protein [Bdellovibrionales bacterium]|nr:beta-lactamase family protein [Bdellovibrionales bacterium]
MKALQQRLDQALNERVFSAYQLYGECRGKELHLWGGETAYWPGASAVTSGTYFDIGSITKVVATTSLLALEVDAGGLDLSRPVSHFIGELSADPLGDRTLEQLLGHYSGLVWWYPLHKTLKKGETLTQWCEREAAKLVAGPVEEKSVYSDVDFWLLTLVAEDLCGPLGEAFKTRIAKPLELAETVYGPLKSHAHVAATEYRSKRKQPCWGDVFDENAAALGGICGHAGLFSTARGLAPFCREWLLALKGESEWLSQPTAQRFIARSPKVKGDWGLGWDLKSAFGSSCGTLFSEKSFGHLGYPGCSLWIDPEHEAFLIFNSNRVHPLRVDERIREWRPEIHDKAMQYWGIQ